MFLILTAAYGIVVLSFQDDPEWLFFIVNNNLLLAPCFFLYVLALTGENIRFHRHWHHFMPYLISC